MGLEVSCVGLRVVPQGILSDSLALERSGAVCSLGFAFDTLEAPVLPLDGSPVLPS